MIYQLHVLFGLWHFWVCNGWSTLINRSSIGWWLGRSWRRFWRPWQIGLVQRQRCSWILFQRPFWFLFVFVKKNRVKTKNRFAQKMCSLSSLYFSSRKPTKIKNGRWKSIHEHRCRRTSPICQGHQDRRQGCPSHQPIDELLIHHVVHMNYVTNSKMP